MTPKVKLLLPLSLFALILSGSLYVFLYTGLIKDRKEVENLYAQISKDRDTVASLEKIELNLSKTVEESKELSSLLLKKDNVVDFIQSIETLMKDARVEGFVESVGEEIKGRDKLNLSLKMKGDWNSVTKMLGLLERLPFKSIITSYALTYGTEQNQKNSALTASSTTILKEPWHLNVMMSVFIANEKTFESTINENTQDEKKI